MTSMKQPRKNQSSTTAPTEEKRRLARVRLYYYLNVYDRRSGENIGSLYDISTKGMKVVGRHPMLEKKRYKFRMELPEGCIFGHTLDIDVESVWTRKEEKTGVWNTGFSILHHSNHGILVIQNLIRDYQRLEEGEDAEEEVGV